LKKRWLTDYTVYTQGPSGEPVVFKKHKVSHKIRTDSDGNKYHADVHLTTKK
jgi:hypothetical protein